MKHGLAGILMLFSVAASAADIQLLLPASGGRFAESTPGHYPVKVNLDALQLTPGDEVKLTLSGVSHAVVYERSTRHDNGDVTWVGYLKDKGNDYRVIITRGKAGSFGRILTPDGEFSVVPGEGVEHLIDRKRAGHEILPMGDDIYIPEGSQRSAPPPETGRQNQFAETEPDGNLEIDLLVLYTPGMVKNYPGDTLKTRLNYLISLANQAYIDSKVGISLRLVHSALVNYGDATSNRVALKDLQYYWSGENNPLSTVGDLREQYGADLVTLIRPYYKTSGNVCGIAPLGLYYDGKMGGSYYSVVSDGMNTDGSKVGCSDYVLAHELGHNMGCMHDRANADAVVDDSGKITHTGEISEGAFPYSFGYGKKGIFGTVMSYISPRIGKFSNPAITCAGEPCGIAETAADSANNALTLNKTRFWVANYMPSGGIKSTLKANDNGTATDVSTGLTWMRCPIGSNWVQGKCDDYSSKSYTWKQAVGLTANFAGYTDWRVPSVSELLSIVDWYGTDWKIEYRVLSPWYSKYGAVSNYWSSTTALTGSSSDPSAWYVAYAYGVPIDGRKNAEDAYSKNAVRLVRGMPLQEAETYIDNGDGTVTHKKTNLIWKRCVEGQTWNGTTCSGTGTQMPWIKAMNLSSTFAGKTDWRLPRINELLTISDFDKINPAVDTSIFPGMATTGKLWSANWEGMYGTFAELSTTGSWKTKEVSEQLFALMVRGSQTAPKGDSTGIDAKQTAGIDINRLFNWAESKYAELFKPAMAATQTFSGYTYRYYSTTKADLAVKDGRVYYRGPLTGGQISDVGALADFLAQAKAAGF